MAPMAGLLILMLSTLCSTMPSIAISASFRSHAYNGKFLYAQKMPQNTYRQKRKASQLSLPEGFYIRRFDWCYGDSWAWENTIRSIKYANTRSWFDFKFSCAAVLITIHDFMRYDLRRRSPPDDTTSRWAWPLVRCRLSDRVRLRPLVRSKTPVIIWYFSFWSL